MFAITVFLCAVVTVMLIGFISYHTYLIANDMTTNEAAKRPGVRNFLEQKKNFLTKWETARLEKKPFKPSAASIEKYAIGKDISVEMSTEDLTQRRIFAEE